MPAHTGDNLASLVESPGCATLPTTLRAQMLCPRVGALNEILLSKAGPEGGAAFLLLLILV